MSDWQTYVNEISAFLENKEFGKAQLKIQEALNQIPNQINLLIVANNVYRLSGDRQKSLEYAQFLIVHHPGQLDGYVRSAEDLVILGRLDEAQVKIQEGLEKIPNQINILSVANHIYRASGNYQKALEYAQSLIAHHPESWAGYGRAVEDLMSLGRLDEAQIKIQDCLGRFPNQFGLLIIANDVYRASGNHEKSLKYAQDLIAYYPEKLQGYGRASDDLLVLRRLDEAQIAVQKGLEKFPNQSHLLIIANNVFRASGNREKSLKYAQDLIVYHPENLQGYERAADDLLVLRRFDEAQGAIQKGLEKFPNQLNLLTIANNIYRASDDLEKSLEYAQSLIAYHPQSWDGYMRAAVDLVGLKRFDEAQAKIQEGLEKFPNQANLLILEGYTSAFLCSPRNFREDLADFYQLNSKDMLAYSHDSRYFSCIQKKRSPFHQQKNFSKNLLFVCGLGRSGTTAMGDLLSISHQVEMYTELFSYFRVDGYKAEDFSQSSIQRALCNHPHQARDQIIFQERHLSAKFVGDKRPGFQYCIQSTYDNFAPGQVTTVFMARDLFSVCKSSHQRSIKPGDAWPIERGIEYVILDYNATIRQINYLYNHRQDVFESILFVLYSAVFASKDIALGIFDSLGLGLSLEESARLDEFIQESVDLVNSKSTKLIETGSAEQLLNDYVNAAIERYVDVEAHQQFCRISKMPDLLR
jgi:tetratricopeptide (TPR) repeat protein